MRSWFALSLWCGSGCLSGFRFLFDSDAVPDPTFHPDEDPDPFPDPSFQIKAQTLKKCSNRLIFQTFWLIICRLMRIRTRNRILIFIWCGCGSGCGSRLPNDADPGYQNDADPCGSESGSTTLQVTCYDQSLWNGERPYAGEGGGVDDESAPPTLVQAHVLQGHLSPLHHRHL